ncbi:MAG: hypothetical protein OEZ33_02215 [Gammaproteobacteria bacterium]|nr:hypothetical protein [Gammaproteobacteria bacterium]MDH5777001.1 hypothetical protein [Gammaproteobacteria bacterium]
MDIGKGYTIFAFFLLLFSLGLPLCAESALPQTLSLTAKQYKQLIPRQPKSSYLFYFSHTKTVRNSNIKNLDHVNPELLSQFDVISKGR